MTSDTPEELETRTLPSSKKFQVTVAGPQGERLQELAALHGMSASTFVAFICNQWVFDNYKDHLDKFA